MAGRFLSKFFHPFSCLQSSEKYFGLIFFEMVTLEAIFGLWLTLCASSKYFSVGPNARSPTPVKSTSANLRQGVVKVTQNVLEHILILEFLKSRIFFRISITVHNQPAKFRTDACYPVMRSRSALRAGATKSYAMSRLVPCYYHQIEIITDPISK